jgi:hypothetical protein
MCSCLFVFPKTTTNSCSSSIGVVPETEDAGGEDEEEDDSRGSTDSLTLQKVAGGKGLTETSTRRRERESKKNAITRYFKNIYTFLKTTFQEISKKV